MQDKIMSIPPSFLETHLGLDHSLGSELLLYLHFTYTTLLFNYTPLLFTYSLDYQPSCTWLYERRIYKVIFSVH